MSESADLLDFYTNAPLLELGAAADRVRQEKHPGNTVTYIIDRNINYTNVCTAQCAFCAFYRDLPAKDGYVLSKDEFRQKIEGLVEAFVEMKKDLDSEKRSFCRIWNKREKQIARAMVNTSALYGDLGCIIGPGLTGIPQLELGSIAEAKRPINRLEDFTESEVGF